MNEPGVVLAYHGCDRSVGERILSGEEHVRVSKNKHDWLGPGAYFWENSPHRALEWGKFLHKNPQLTKKPIKEPFVIGAILLPGRCLDLTEAHSLGILRRLQGVCRDDERGGHSSSTKRKGTLRR